MLTEPIVAGASYVDGDGDVFTDFTFIPTLNLWVGFHATYGVFKYTPNGSYVLDGASVDDAYNDYNLVRRHLPVPQGVYHVSDGDTQLKQELDAWIANGGGWECRGIHVQKEWVKDHTCSKPFWSEDCFYRAVGCTQDREFPQPAPPSTPQPDPLQRPMTFADFITYVEHLHCGDNIVNWLRNRAQEAGRA